MWNHAEQFLGPYRNIANLKNIKSLILKKCLMEEEGKKNKVGFRFASND